MTNVCWLCLSLLPSVALLGPRTAGGVAASPRDPSTGTAIVRVFLASLDETARHSVAFPFDVPERRRWRRDPSPRAGLAMKDLTDPQRALVEQLLKNVLSQGGFAKVAAIRQEQDLLGRDEEGLGAGYYWFAVYGEPGDGRWAWRFGGHHVSIHITYDTDRIVSATPLHLGGEQLEVPADCWAGYERLRAYETLARKVASDCDASAWKAALLSEKAFDALTLSEGQAIVPRESPDGVPISTLTPVQREALADLIDEYTSVLADPFAQDVRQFIGSRLGRGRFGWAGSRTPADPHYYAIRGPGFLVEYNNAGAHMHTILRTGTDFGEPDATP